MRLPEPVKSHPPVRPGLGEDEPRDRLGGPVLLPLPRWGAVLFTSWAKQVHQDF